MKEFRGWDKENKIMLYSKDYDYLDLKYNRFMIWEDRHLDFDILMEYTGLKDKNNKKIFKGDIITYKIKQNIIKRIVQYDVILSSWMLFPMDGCNCYYFHDTDNSIMEVIGNIYKNPELLEEK